MTTDSVWIAAGSVALLAVQAQTAIKPADLAATLRDASVDGGESVELVIVSQMDCDGPRLWRTIGGLKGADTVWDDSGLTMTTDGLVRQLERNDGLVTGYGVSLTGPTRMSAISFAGEMTTFGSGDAATPEAYAAVGSLPLSRATSTGVQVGGSGFDPDEVIELASIEHANNSAFSQSIPAAPATIFSRSTTVSPAPALTLRTVASGWPTGLSTDANGAFAGTLVLPATLVQGPGTYSIVLRGIASGKTAMLSLTLTADAPAPSSSTSVPAATPAVAVAVPARVSYTC